MHRFLFLILLVSLLSGCSTIRSTRLLVPSWFGFTRIADGVFVDEAMAASQRDDFLKTVAVSKARISSFFGEIQMTATVIGCASETCFTANGGVGAKGKAYGSSVILLSPRGLNEVILAHELTHIELHGRIGTFRSWRSIPQWFDEGLAVLVSNDPRYTQAEWLLARDNVRDAPSLEALGKSIRWGDSNWLLSYGTARHIIGEWYASAGLSGLLRLISEVRRGKPFQTAFDGATIPSDPALNLDLL